MKRKRLIIVTLIVLAAIATGGILLVQHIEHEINQAYALKRTNYLLADYVCQHEAWPSDWRDLVPFAEATLGGSGESEITYLKDVVGINWDLNVVALMNTAEGDDRSSFEVASLLSGSDIVIGMDSYDEVYFEILTRCPEWETTDEGPLDQ